MSKTLKAFNPLIATTLLILTLTHFTHAEPLKIGALLPLTGDFGFFGEQAKQGIELALKEINKDGEKVQVIYEDEQCLPKTALTSYTKLTSIDQVDYVLGPVCTGSIVTVAEQANRIKKYMLALLDTNRPVANAGPYTYALGYSSEEEAEIVADYMHKKGIKTAGIIYEEDAWAINVKDAFRARFESQGGKILSEEAQLVTNASSAPNYRPIIMKVNRYKPEALYVVPAYNGGNFLKQAKSIGITTPIFGPDTFAITEVIEIAGQSAEGVICANALVNEDSEMALKLRAKLKESFKSEPSSIFYPALGYDGIQILYKAHLTKQEFPTAMENINYTNGVIQVQGFSKEGISKLNAGLFQIKNQKIVRLLEE